MGMLMRNNNVLKTQELLEHTYKFGNRISGSDGELLPVFDEKQMKEIGVAPRLLCHRLGLIHKVVYLIIQNEKKEFLIQIRGDGRADVPVGGHVSATDTSDVEALRREALEELGIQLRKSEVKPYKIYFQEEEYNPKKPCEINREIRQLYVAQLPDEIESNLDVLFSKRKEQNAVKSIKWASLAEIQIYLADGKVAGGLKHSLTHIKELL